MGSASEQTQVQILQAIKSKSLKLQQVSPDYNELVPFYKDDIWVIGNISGLLPGDLFQVINGDFISLYWKSTGQLFSKGFYYEYLDKNGIPYDSLESYKIATNDFFGETGKVVLTPKSNLQTNVVQTTGTSETDVMSQKAVTDESARLEQESIDRTFKTLNIGASGLVTLKPSTSYFTYRLNVTDNLTLNVDLSRMIEQVGNARCRLIIDMPIVRTITFAKPMLWGGTVPTFSTAGQYVLEVIDVDGSGTPLVWLVASTTKVQSTGNILYVDSTGANYTASEINGEVATRTTSSWANPFKYLQNAINASVAGDIIFVKKGVYKPTHLGSTPTTYIDGDCLNVNAQFTLNKAVDIYGGFVGTETKTWQRVTKEFGLMQNETILCGDVRNEAVIDPAILIGDRRTTASKANSVKKIMHSSGALRYVNGFVFRYANANSSGGAISTTDNNTVLMNSEFRDITNSGNGAAWYYLYSVNNFVRNTTAGSTVYSLASNYNINCRIMNHIGHGFYNGNNINCVVSGGSSIGNIAFYSGENRNCIALNNTTNNWAGYIIIGNHRNTTAINNQTAGGCPTANVSDAINCLLFGNKAGTAAGYFRNVAEAGVVKFRNNASDAPNPTVTGGAGSNIDLTTCLQNVTAEQVKIILPTFVGAPTTQAQVSELYQYLIEIPTKLQPGIDSILKGAGIMLDDVTTLDYNAKERGLTTCTIGAIEAI